MGRFVKFVEGRDYSVGDVFHSEIFGEYVITKIQGPSVVNIKFSSTSGETVTDIYRIFKGSVNDPYKPVVAGVGYMGVGPYRSVEYIEGKRVSAKAHQVWRDMLFRVYNEKSAGYCQYGAKGVIVHPEWMCYQNFAEWHEKNVPDVAGIQLDKDILVQGNLVYGPDTCVAVPSYVNSAFHKHVKGKYLMGVIKVRQIYAANAKYDGTSRFLGSYYTEMEAHVAWQEAKVENLKTIGDRYIGDPYFDVRVYDSIHRMCLLIEEDIREGRPTRVFQV